MGSLLAKGARKTSDDPRVLNQKIRALEDELMQVKSKREREIRAQNRRMAFFAMKEGEWKRERKRWKEEVSRLKRRLEEKEEVIRQVEAVESVVVVGKKEKMNAKELQMFDASLLMVEQMRAEQARREEAVEKWKRLYLAIKTELDELIRRTAQGERLWWGSDEEDLMEALQKELKAKEETMEVLKARISSMEMEGAKREREMDILRQSLRIMSNNKKAHLEQKKLLTL
ncbi:hypothetical protein ACLOJK_011191 [Asimina triloba]